MCQLTLDRYLGNRSARCDANVAFRKKSLRSWQTSIGTMSVGSSAANGILRYSILWRSLVRSRLSLQNYSKLFRKDLREAPFLFNEIETAFRVSPKLQVHYFSSCNREPESWSPPDHRICRQGSSLAHAHSLRAKAL